MLVQDVIDLASFSELSSTAIKDNTPVILLFLNAAMLELHKRFPLKIEEQVLVLVEGVTTYPVNSDFLYVLDAYGEVSEDNPNVLAPKVPINEENDPRSIFFPNHREVLVPLTTNGAIISLVYAAKPPRYTEVDLATELDLPDTLIEPLLQYMAYKAHAGITAGIQDEHNTHYRRFDSSCRKARELGVAYPLDSWCMPDRLFYRGFP